MTIPDEAVRAAQEATEGGYGITDDYMRAALTAAAPFLQGVKVKALEWTKGVVDMAQPHPGMKYVACSTTPKGSWAWWLDNAPETRDVFSSEEAAKAAAQADYETRILSAIDVAPSPRAQALEEAALERSIERWRGMKPSEVMKGSTAQITYALEDARKDILTLYSALSSQPVADPLPTHRHKKRGTEYAMIGVGKMQAENWQVSKDGFDQSIDMEEVAIYRSVDDGVIWVRPRAEFEDGRFEALPASPGASE